MAGIEEYLNKIKNAVYGREVRQAIHDGIETCYIEGKAGATDLVARDRITSVNNSLSNRIDEIIAPSGEAPSAAEVTDARIGVNDTVYTSLGEAIREQLKDLNVECCSNSPFVFDREALKITIPQGFIKVYNQVRSLNAQTINLGAVPTTYNAWLLRYHWDSQVANSYIYAEQWNANQDSADHYIGYVYDNICVINGLRNRYRSPFGFVTNNIGGYKGFIAWDKNTKKLTVGEGGFIVTDAGTFNLANGVYDFSSVVTTADAYQILFDAVTNTVKARAWNSNRAFTGYLIGMIYNNALSVLGGVNVLESRQVVYCFGDSITAGVGHHRPYHLDLAMADNVICYNWGIGSTGFVTTASGSVVAGNGVIGDGDTITASGNNTILDVMTGKTFTACTIFAGTNDYGGSVALDTFRTAVQNTLDYALEQTSNILVITPIKRVGYTNQNQRGATLADYADIIKEECASRNIGCFDGFDIPIDPTDTRQKNRLAPDGLHPNDLGHRMIAGAVRSAFEANCGVL